MVTIPTIDQISGSTVMNKMRSLINAFINFANEVDTALTVTIPEYVDDALASYYTQTEINNMLDNYYTKTDVYTKTEVNSLLATKRDDFYPAVPLKFVTVSNNSVLNLDYVPGILTLVNNKLDVSADMVLRAITVDSPLYKERGEVGQEVDALGISIDNDTIQINQSGQMYCAVEGATYTAGDGILIDANNEISVKGWTQETTKTDWSSYMSNGKTTKDLLIVLSGISNSNILYSFILPKNTYVSGKWIQLPPITDSNTLVVKCVMSLGDLFSNYTWVKVYKGTLSFDSGTSTITISESSSNYSRVTSAPENVSSNQIRLYYK